MKQSQLILSRTPPFPAPLRFFMTAPLFGVLAAALMLWLDESHFGGRWSAGMLAYVHLLVLGYLAMVMQGALLQVVSVVTGGRPWRAGPAAAVLQGMLSAGTLLLAAGFLTGWPWLMPLAALLLLLSCVLFFGVIVSGLRRSTARRDTGLGIAQALCALLITAALGGWLAIGHGVPGVPLPRHLTDSHLAWGLLGWGAVLLITVAYIVVPMFQLTPTYPAVLTRVLAPWLIVALALRSAGVFLQWPLLSWVADLSIAIGLALFAVVTLWLQQRRKKKPGLEVTLWFWRCAMGSLLAAVALWIAAQLFPALGRQPGYPLLLGGLMIHGVLISAVNGMLYKILPFLTWLHLSVQVTECRLSRRLVPNIRKLLPEARVRLQFWLHLVMLLLLFAAPGWPAGFLVPAALAFAASNLLLWWNLWAVLRIYRRTRGLISEAAAEKRTAESATGSPT